ncbi:DUF6443 domain-containing protein [Chryseobacterium jejuense]|uniref:RHS repeat-associated core domain n=1 Tax=Chryseobacterium jejuense TaxID=445960 RepID=A0A2X2Z056_CHRJE|nr:DUF6443 domain-containing protein [Chryseobacterium jejuense]SDJ64730.1 RHS repeat-associated core domain-containing protein [Chryseobacterium jejuense]SQB43299.1 RHS repeat-associated core domain [Chryseobacterium jejuense]
MHKKIYISIGLLWSLHHFGQIVLTTPPAPNTEVSDPVNIRMLPGFQFNSVNGTFRAYIGGAPSGNGDTYTPITVDYSSNIPGTENYIYTRQYLVPTTVSDGSLQQIQNVQFFDGLGRPKQAVSIKSTSSGKDLVTHIPYDGFGRQVDSWLPVPMASLNGNIQTGVETSANSYYQSNDINDSYPFAHKTLENSPLDRVLNQNSPGNDWKNKPVIFGYEANVQGEVKKYTTVTTWPDGATSSELSISGTYGEAQLYKNTITDEDHNKTIEFKNGKGQTLLVRKVISSSENADTYYVYNEYDQLVFVIPPLASTASAVSATVKEDLCYQYRYDGKSRLVEKKLPGKGWEKMVYDKSDRLILTQDANLKDQNKWLINKYDKLGRIAYTGLLTGGDRAGRENQIKDLVITEDRSTTGFTRNGITVYYTDSAFVGEIPTILNVNYYDTYPQEAPSVTTVLNQDVLPQAQNSDVSTKSLPTASYTKNIENDSWTKVYTYYDKRGRAIANHSLNHLGGYTKTESYLKFSGVPEYTLIEHKRTANDPKINLKETFEYDHQERLVRHWNQVNGGAQELLAENLYNDLGQLQTKNVGNTTGSPLQRVKYVYNIRGWMTKLNDPSNLQNKLFAYELRYNKPNSQYSGSARYNGNISQMSWITQNDAVLRNYSYEYDALNRLKEGRFWDAMNLERGEYHEQLTYDLNGNIRTLLRRGKQLPGYTAPEVMDHLEYHYENVEQSNKLSYLKEIGTGNAISGYPLAAGSTGSTITYDANGNMTTQVDKGISSIQYNYLNLPGKITQNAKVTDYIYKADGVKVRKVFGTEITDYLDGFQYTNSILKFFPTAEGYFNAETGKYVYNYTDHLGNTRLSYSKNGLGTEIIEENNYYPFGLKHEGYNTLLGNSAYQYKYNGKELQENGMYDYGARFYMPDIGRWGVADELAEKSRRFSPYTYALDNPIMFVDPDGKEAQGCCGNLWNLAKTYYSGMYQGAKGVATETYQGVKQIVTDPGGTAKSIYNNSGSILKAGVNKGVGAVATAISAPAIAVDSFKKGDATGAGKIAGKALAEMAIIAGTEGAGSAIKGSITAAKTARTISKLGTEVNTTAAEMFNAGKAPAAIVGAELNGKTAIGISGAPPSTIAPQLEGVVNELGGLGTRTASGNPVGCCAEFNAGNELLLNNPSATASQVNFTEAIRPRTGKVVPMCDNCKATFGK